MINSYDFGIESDSTLRFMVERELQTFNVVQELTDYDDLGLLVRKIRESGTAK